jgi:8-oxo-dGTP pyrophosphatase MutT (NUDIX family)
MSARNRWITRSEKILVTSPVLDILQRDCVSSEDGREHRFYLLTSKDWCNIVPVTREGKVVMVRQFRVGISGHTLEFPGGVADGEGEDARAAALRELAEETGYAPLPDARVQDLGWSFPNPAILNNRSHCFAVGPVARQGAQELDAGEMIEVVELSFAEIPERIARGEIRHALTLNTLFFLLLQARDGRELLTRELGSYR